MFITPMKAAAITRLPANAEQYVLQPKLDGWRVIAGASESGVWLESSTGNRITSVPYINEALALILPPNTVIDGEISDEASSRERSWNRTQTILSRHGTHAPNASDPPLTFAAFDALIVDGEDIMGEPLGRRLVRLVELFGPWVNDPLARLARMLECLACTQDELDRLLSEGYEGVVVKDVGTRYVQGGRSGEWCKLKPDQEIEAEFTGTYPATPGSKYEGRAVGGITFRVVHSDGRAYEGRAAGMDDRLREELYRDPDAHLGQVVELTHKGITADGALRHPQYRRFRDPIDKPKASVPAVFEQANIDPAPKRKAVPKHRGAVVDHSVVIERDGKRTPAVEPATVRPPVVPLASVVAPARGRGTQRKRRMRNYSEMLDAKLLGCLEDLRNGPGWEAYDRCMERGSGDPARDLHIVEQLCQGRGISL